MPLLRGRSKRIIGKNIATEIRHGRPRAQAIAIAFSKAGKSRTASNRVPKKNRRGYY